MNTKLTPTTEAQLRSMDATPLLRTTAQGLMDTSASSQLETALVYCEGNFGEMDGKTANGLVRASHRFQIEGVIDSDRAGQDAGTVLDGQANGIPIYRDLNQALRESDRELTHFIFGVAPLDGQFSAKDRYVIFQAMEKGLHIINGLHEFLTNDESVMRKAQTCGVTVTDIRKPAPSHELNVFSGKIMSMSCPRIAVLGTDTAIGKRTTATILVQALRSIGINALMIATGQTGLMQGTPYGVAIDAIPAQFAAGELETAILTADREQQPDIIIVEGQGALSHPAYSSSSLIIRGCVPDAIVLQHAPGRPHRGDFPDMPMADVQSEIDLLKAFCGKDVIALTMNPEHLDGEQMALAMEALRTEFGLPVADVVAQGADSIISQLFDTFPALRQKRKRFQN